MKNLLPFTIVILFFSACGESTTSKSDNKTNINITDQPTKSNIQYKLLSEDEGIDKSNINIELPEKISEEEIRTIANELRATRQNISKLWIFYYLPGMKIDAGAWATSHFTPELKIEIIGSTEAEEAKLKDGADDVDGEIIGKYYEPQLAQSTYTVYEKDNKTYIKISFTDGTSANEEMKTKTVKNGTRLDYKKRGYNNEYYILTNMGVLEFYNAEDIKFTSANKID